MLFLFMSHTPGLWAGVGQWTTGGPPGAVGALAVDPETAAVAYAVASDNSGNSRLYKTANSGSAWALTALADQQVSVVAAGPGRVVYAGTSADSVYKSLDDGATWVQLVLGVNQVGATILKVDLLAPSIIYRAVGAKTAIGSQSGALFRSTDSGATWTDISVNFIAPRALALDPNRSGVVYLSDGSYIYRSVDFGTSWSALGTGSIGSVTALAVDPVTPSSLYVGTLFGVLKSTDGGASFAPASPDFGSYVSNLALDPTRKGRLYASTVSKGVFATSDGGGAWAPFNSGLTNLGVYILAQDRAGAFLHAGTGSGVFDYEIGSAACLPDETAACLQDARFRVSVAWSAPSGQSGPGRRLDVTTNTTGFWFFDPTNVELVVKVLDGRQINGKWWVFYGALSNVGYSITVTDTLTGATRTYFNPQGQLASVADTAAF